MGSILIVVDAANVVGSVPDGWWRDRVGAATRLRDRLAAVGGERLGRILGNDQLTGLSDIAPCVGDVVLVVEGKARGVAGVPGVRVVAAAGSGDDAIVDVVMRASDSRRCVVVTADRQLRRRVGETGAQVVGPATLLRELAV